MTLKLELCTIFQNSSISYFLFVGTQAHSILCNNDLKLKHSEAIAQIKIKED